MPSSKFRYGIKYPCSKISLKQQSRCKKKIITSEQTKSITFHGDPTKNVIDANKKVALLSSKEFDSWHEISVSEVKNYKITCHHASSMDSSTIIWAFKLCKEFMMNMYEQSSCGWSDEEKYNELNDVSARYLIVQEAESSRPVAFTHFRFDMDYKEEVLYCYELHVERNSQRFGLGKLLLQLLELLAMIYKMNKVILTVFKVNTVALAFYKKLGYTEDGTCPIDSENETFDYLILSKYIRGREN